MGFISSLTYNLFMFPFEKAILHEFRRKSVSKASGDVLEIGVGTGVNSRYLLKSRISSLTVIDTSIKSDVIRSMEKQFKNFSFMEKSVEELPFEDNSFDSIVFTLVFCSVVNPEKGLAEIRRVLRDDGTLIFIEHVRPEGTKTRNAADKVNPYWNTISNGCNINRETLSAIKGAGFEIHEGTYEKKGVFITGTARKQWV